MIPAVVRPTGVAARLLGSFPRADALWVGLCVAIGLVFRTIDLGATSLWTDEFFTLIAYRRPLAESLFQRQDYTPPLYQLLLRVLTDAETPREAVLRAPAVLFGTAEIVAGWWLGRLLFGRRVALCTALLVAVNPAYVQYSRVARSYSLWVLAATLSVAFFVRMIRHGRWRDATGFVISSVVMAYAHYYAVFTLAAEAGAFCLSLSGPKADECGRRVTIAFGLITLGMTPIVWLVLQHVRSGPRGSIGYLCMDSWARSGSWVNWSRRPNLGRWP